MYNRKRPEATNLLSRRAFLNRAAAGTAAMTLQPVSMLISKELQELSEWPENADQTIFHMIGQAHIDPVWLWPWTEGIAVVHSTFRSALDRMNENPEFTFTASSAQFYQWIAENDPEMLREIRKRVEEGRWNVVGGWWVEPDVNMPSGEALVRQGLYGQMTFERLLGRRATVGYNPDSFGHPGSLPQILKGQGLENYVFMRPMPREKELPSDLFWWESMDGSRVLVYRIPISYNDSRPAGPRIRQILALMKDKPFRSCMSFYGAGDHGGGATKENIESIKELQSEKGAPRLIFSTPSKYFEEIRSGETLNLPTLKDDLQHHSVGCYTAESGIKKGNRIAEAALVTAEKIASVGSFVWGSNYPMNDFTEAWKRVLFLQFHDSLAGTSIPEHSLTAREGFGYASDIANRAIALAVQKLEWQVPSEDPASNYLLAFNTCAWDVTTILEYDFDWDLRYPSRVEDEKGNLLAHQWTWGSSEAGNRRKLAVRTTLPGFGYRQIKISRGTVPEIPEAVKVSENIMENQYLVVRFSDTGMIGITDKESGQDVFFGGLKGCRAVIIDDPSDTWSHDVKSYKDEYGSFGKATMKFTETGPLRAVARMTSYYGSSVLTVDWLLSAGSRYLEAKVNLDWHEHLKMLKFSFPVNIVSPVATYETPYGFIVRTPVGDEEPGQRWIDVSGNISGKSYGFALINDAKYGYSVEGNVVNLSVSRSAVYAHHTPRQLDMNSEHRWQDQGIQTFRMLLVPHQGTWQNSGIPRITEEFISPSITMYQGIHRGSMPKSGSFITAEPENIILTALKRSETGDDLVIRLVEVYGLKTSGSLNLKLIGKTWEGDFRPCEIKTLRLNLHNREIREVNLLEE
jgi:alpha-mannosidase